MRNLNILEADVDAAQNFCDLEKIHPLNRNTLFQGGLYVILSAAENYAKQMAAFQDLREAQLFSADAIAESNGQLEEIVKKTRWGTRRAKHIRQFAEWWRAADLPDRLIADVTGAHEHEFELRKERARHGIQMRVSSSSHGRI